jgi:hypothetical protein
VVTVLRFANVLGTDLVTPISANLSRPLCPSIFGFDPLLQFVEEDDVVRCLEHVTRHGIPGLYNVAGAGKLPWSEVAGICGTLLLPLRPPATQDGRPLVRSACSTFPELGDLLRYGRGVDTDAWPRRASPAATVGRCGASNFIRALRLPQSVGKPAGVVHVRARRRAVLPPLLGRRS